MKAPLAAENHHLRLLLTITVALDSLLTRLKEEIRRLHHCISIAVTTSIWHGRIAAINTAIISWKAKQTCRGINQFGADSVENYGCFARQCFVLIWLLVF